MEFIYCSTWLFRKLKILFKFLTQKFQIAVYKDNQILTYFSVVYSYPNLVGLVVMILIGHKIPIQIRVMGTFACFFFLLLTVPILGFAQIQNAPVVGLIITFSVLVLLAFGTSILRKKKKKKKFF